MSREGASRLTGIPGPCAFPLSTKSLSGTQQLGITARDAKYRGRGQPTRQSHPRQLGKKPGIRDQPFPLPGSGPEEDEPEKQAWLLTKCSAPEEARCRCARTCWARVFTQGDASRFTSRWVCMHVSANGTRTRVFVGNRVNVSVHAWISTLR